MKIPSICIIGVLLCVTTTEGKHISGILRTGDEWKYLSRFCFLPQSGTLQFSFVYPTSYITESLLLYWDKPSLWISAYTNKSMTCKEKEALLDITSYQIFRLHPSYGICIYQGNSTIVCQSNRLKFLSARERWWFMAISNCLTSHGLYMQYDVYMRNGEPGDFFREHFSADELYILEFNIAFFFIELIMMVLVAVVSVKLMAIQMFHSTYKIFLASVVFFYASIMATCIAYMTYASKGIENVGLKTLGTALYAVSQVLMVLMLLLLGLGYTVVCGRLPHWGIICLSVFMSTFAVTYVALYIVEAVTFDPALVLYRWESTPGYGLLAIILAAWVFFLGSCIFTMVKHKKKAAFYGPMVAFYTFWFIAIPVTVGINMKEVPDYMRAKVVNFVEVIILFLAHVFYLIFTWPSLANKNFPFHIRTTQIDVITFEAASREADAAAAKSGDLVDGGQFTDFSVFTVPEQRPSFVPSVAVAATAGFGGFQGIQSDGGGGGDSDWDSGVAMPTRGEEEAASAAIGDSPPPGSDDSGDARLLEGAALRDGENTAERPAVEEPAEAPPPPVPTWLHAAPSGGSRVGLLPPI